MPRAPSGTRLSATVIGPGLLAAPVKVNVIDPVTVPLAGSPADGTTEIDRFAGPVPDAGLTWSHG